jgi:hypothetical protein
VEKGWKHVVQRHITGDHVKSNTETDFFPIKDKITINGKTIDTEELMTRNDVKRLFREAIENGKASQTYVVSSDIEGVGKVKVHIEGDGRIGSMYPVSGSEVPEWVPGTGWTWAGAGSSTVSASMNGTNGTASTPNASARSGMSASLSGTISGVCIANV